MDPVYVILSEALQVLKKAGVRITPHRCSIIKCLAERLEPLSVQAIYEKIGTVEVDLATIYRNIHLLERIGLVKRVFLGDAIARYELVRANDPATGHYLVCKGCRQVERFSYCELDYKKNEPSLAPGYLILGHKLEIFALCPKCLAKQQKGTRQ